MSSSPLINALICHHTQFSINCCVPMVLEYKYYLLTVLTSSKKVKLRISSEKSRQTYCPFVPIHVGEKCIHVWRLLAFTKPTFSMQNPPFQCKTHLFNAKSTFSMQNPPFQCKIHKLAQLVFNVRGTNTVKTL